MVNHGFFVSLCQKRHFRMKAWIVDLDLAETTKASVSSYEQTRRTCIVLTSKNGRVSESARILKNARITLTSSELHYQEIFSPTYQHVTCASTLAAEMDSFRSCFNFPPTPPSFHLTTREQASIGQLALSRTYWSCFIVHMA